jgi:membrane protease YdiL (CAAX protease family)
VNEDDKAQAGDPRRILIITAWVVILAVSDLPDIVWNALAGRVPAPLFWGKVAFLAVFLGLTFLVKVLRRLKPYALFLAVFYLALGLKALVRATAWFQDRFNSPGVSFFQGFMAEFVLDIGVALAVIAVLWIIKRDRRAFFMTKGRLDAPIEPVRWLGIKAGGSWKTFGWIFAGVAALGVLIPTILAIAPSTATLVKTLPFLPAVLLFAAINAFTEEVYFRAGPLATLTEIIGKNQTLLLTAVFFGLAHWLYGSPPGLVGFLMTGFLAWLMAKSMLETRGIAWPWLIHFLPDVVIFFSYVLLRVKG